MKTARKSYLIIVNIITLSRIPLAILFGFFCMNSEHAERYCCMIFLLTVITDLLDGKIARRHNVTSNIGAWLDILCDFFFIIVSSLSLCLTGKMDILLLIIISLKFTEFLLTSYWNRCLNNKQDVLLFDPFGRWLAALYYCLPTIILLLNDIFLRYQTGLIITIAFVSILSSVIRIGSCCQRAKSKDSLTHSASDQADPKGTVK